MANLGKLLDMRNRVVGSLARIQDEAYDTGDFSKVEATTNILDKLDAMATRALQNANVPPPQETDAPPMVAQGPTAPAPSAPLPWGNLGAGETPAVETPPLQSTEFLPDGTPTPLPPEAPPMVQPLPAGLINPLGLPQQAPVVVNVGTPQQAPPLIQPMNRAKMTMDEQRLHPESVTETPVVATPQQQNVEKYKAANSTIQEADKHVKEYIKNMYSVVAAGAMDPGMPNFYAIENSLKTGDWKKVASDIRGVMGEVGDYDKPSLQFLLPKAEAAIAAQEQLEAMRKPGGPLGLTRGEVMPIMTKLQQEQAKLSEQLKGAGSIEAPQIIKKQNELAKSLANAREFDAQNPPPPLIAPEPNTPQQGEPGEAEAMAGMPEAPVEMPAPLPPVDYELQREPVVEIKPEEIAPAAKKAYKTGKALVEDVAENYIDEDAERRSFYKRIALELGQRPKPTFGDYLAIMFGAGPQIAQKWAHDRNAWEQGRQRIGSEIYNARKAAQSQAGQDRRLSVREQAAHERALERDEASASRLEKTLAAGRERSQGQLGLGYAKLEEARRAANMRANVQIMNIKLQDKIANDRNMSNETRSRLQILMNEANNITKQANATFMDEGEWSLKIKPIYDQMKAISGINPEGE